MAKIRLINTIKLQETLFPPISLAYLKAFLKNQGVYAEIFDLDVVVKNLNSKNNSKAVDLDYFKSKISNVPNYLKNNVIDEYFDSQIEEMISLLNIAEGEILGFSVPQREIFLTLYFAKKIKEIKKCSIILGGPDIKKLRYEQLNELIKEFNISYVDFFVKDNAYRFFENLVTNRLRLNNKVPLIIDYSNETEKGNNTYPDFPIIPEYNKEHLDLYRIKPEKIKSFFLDVKPGFLKKFEELKGKTAPLVVPHAFQLGCVKGICAYCGYKKKLAYKKVDKTITDIENLKKKYKTNNFFFLNYDIAFKKEYTEQLMNRFTNELNIKWSDSANISHVNPAMLRRFSEAGCIQLFMGITTGSKKLQEYIWGQENYDRNKHFSKCFRAADENGIWLITDVICGLPYERLSDIIETRNFFLRNKNYINWIIYPSFRMMKNSPFAETPNCYGLNIFQNKRPSKNITDKVGFDMYRYSGLGFGEKYGLNTHEKLKQINFSYKYFKNFIDQTFPNQTIDWYPVYLLYNNFDSKKEIKKFLRN